MKPSKQFSLNKADIQVQLKSALIFLGPSILAFLVALTPALDSVTPDTTQKMILVMALKWGLDQATGLLRRYLAGK